MEETLCTPESESGNLFQTCKVWITMSRTGFTCEKIQPNICNWYPQWRRTTNYEHSITTSHPKNKIQTLSNRQLSSDSITEGLNELKEGQLVAEAIEASVSEADFLVAQSLLLRHSWTQAITIARDWCDAAPPAWNKKFLIECLLLYKVKMV